MSTSRIDRIGPFEYRRFAPRVPAPGGASHRVAIIGGGPVGLALALGLARHGVASVIVEADDSVCEGSRAACISRRSLEIIERLGAVDAFMAKGLPWTDGHSFYRDHEVLHFSMPHDAAQKYPPMINLQQYYIEQFLLDAAEAVNAERPGTIDIRWVSTVTGLRQQEAAVELDVENALGRYALRAEWVAACDGGQSFARKALGLELEGTAYTGRYVIIDIELPSPSPTERRAWFDPPWNPGSTVLMHRQPDDLWRIDYQLRQGDDAEHALQPERVREFVQSHLDAIGEGHLPWRPAWTSVYRAGAMTLDSYRHGRVLFAGNAAHAMPIFGVRGLNSGFDDADNLAWKLAQVVRGVSPPALLDSYSRERIEAFHINAAHAMRSTEFMSPPSRGFDVMREACLSLAREHRDIAPLINPRQTQAVSYTDSPLSSAGDAFECGPPPGAPLADLPVQGRCSHLSGVLDVPGFVALVFDNSRALARALADAGRAATPPLRVARIAAAPAVDGDGFATVADPGGAAFESYGARPGSVYLVRPDGHVAGRWHAPPASLVIAAARRASALAPHGSPP